MPKYYVDTSIGYSRAHGARLHDTIVPYCMLIEAETRDAAIILAHAECRHRARDGEGHDPRFFTLVERLKEVSDEDFANNDLFMQWRDAYADEDYVWHRRLADGKTKILPVSERVKPNYVPMSEMHKYGYKMLQLDQLSADVQEEVAYALRNGGSVPGEFMELLEKTIKQQNEIN